MPESGDPSSQSSEECPAEPDPQDAQGGDEFVRDDLPTAAEERDDLDELRIRKITKMRRTAYRSRGYLLIACVLCVALAGQLVWVAIGEYRQGAVVLAVGFVLSAMILLALAWRAFLRARELKAEADASALSEPKTPPDFSKLSDGSQAWKNLEDVE